MTTPLRDYTKIEEKHCQLVTCYGRKKFSCPHDIAIRPNNEVVMVESDNAEVIIFDKDFKFTRTFGQGSGDSKLNYPVGVAVNLNVIAVSEFTDHVVKIFSIQGDYLTKFGSRGGGDSQFNKSQGDCVLMAKYVVDFQNGRVQVFKDDEFLFKFGSKACNTGQFKEPRYIAEDNSDLVYVTDQSDAADGVNVFTEDGYFIKKINYNKPYAICIAPDGYMLTGSYNDNDVTVLSPTCELIIKLGICGIEINTSGTVFVTERINKRVQIITP